MIEVETDATIGLDDWCIYLPYHSDTMECLITLGYELEDCSFDYAGSHCSHGLSGTHVDIQSRLLCIAIHEESVKCGYDGTRIKLTDVELAHYEIALFERLFVDFDPVNN